MPKCNAGWSRIRVALRRGQKQFVHGSRALTKLRADSFEGGVSIRVFREGVFYDLGKTADLPSGIQFVNLQEVVPESERKFRDPPEDPGVVEALLPEWFSEGDELHVGLFPAQLRAALATWSFRDRR